MYNSELFTFVQKCRRNISIKYSHKGFSVLPLRAWRICRYFTSKNWSSLENHVSK